MDRQLVKDLAREVVTVTAPAEAGMFELTADAYLDDPARAKAARSRSADRDEPLGFGLAASAALLTPVVLYTARQVLDLVIDKAVSHGGAELATAYRRWRSPKAAQAPAPATAGNAAPPPAATDAAGGHELNDLALSLDEADLAAIRTAAEAAAAEFGASTEEAAGIATAIVSTLSRRT